MTTQEIKAFVAAWYDVPVSQLAGRDRTQRVSWARKVAMFLCWREEELNLSEIGRRFDRDHSAVTVAVELVAFRKTAPPGFLRSMERRQERQRERDMRAAERAAAAAARAARRAASAPAPLHRTGEGRRAPKPIAPEVKIALVKRCECGRKATLFHLSADICQVCFDIDRRMSGANAAPRVRLGAGK